MEQKNRGFTMIELIAALAIIAILMLVLLFAYLTQMTKSRDSRRKADLAKLQMILEDYMNDNICYSETLTCGQDFSPYLSSIPCDPINKGANIYYYSVSQELGCKKWYKIFTNLENKDDPIIAKIGCTPDKCGAFNYLVSSPNVEVLVQQPGEVPPPLPSPTPTPTPGGGATPTPTPTPGGGATPTPTPTPGGGGPTPTPTPGGGTPTPTPTNTPTPTPTVCPAWYTCIGQAGKCNFVGSYQPGAVCSSNCNGCTSSECLPGCY